MACELDAAIRCVGHSVGSATTQKPDSVHVHRSKLNGAVPFVLYIVNGTVLLRSQDYLISYISYNDVMPICDSTFYTIHTLTHTHIACTGFIPK